MQAAVALRGLERVRSGSWSDAPEQKRRVVELLSDGGYSPLDLQGDFTRAGGVAAAPISGALVRVSRRLAVPSACVGVAELPAGSATTWPFTPSTLLPRRALTVTIEGPEYCARCFR
jgi:hypothetical protein